ncbi:T9SS type A sorting domain-containing protein [Flavobacterium sp.]|uniref:T9SS type A sorting domain-containing protein n=1 Tax=Flavobacterium sp. TaxID=239 RepID=UPI0037525831
MKQNVLQKPIPSFTKEKFWTKTIAMLLFFVALNITKTNAQIAFTVTGNTNATPNLATSYTSLTNMLTAVNAITAVTGNIFIGASVGSETAPIKGFTIGSTSLNAAMAGSTFRIYISGNGSSTTINANVGTATPSSPSPDGMVKLVGANNILFGNFFLVDGNTTNPATMEFGIGLFKASATDGCINNAIYDNEIRMQRVNFAPGSGSMPAGATGIIMVNSTPTAAITPLTPTSVAGANSDNQIAGNIIDGGNNGIHLSGYGIISPNSDYNNVIGNSNNIRNFGGGANTASFATGITANNQWNVLITNNIIDNNTGTGVNTQYTLYGISVGGGGNNSNVNIAYNAIKLQSASGTFLLYGIFNSAGNGTGTVNINDNVINLGSANRTSGTINGIIDASTPAVLNMNYNTVEGIVGVPLAGTGDINGIINTSNIATVNTTGNNVRNFDRTGTSGNLFGMQITATNWNATGNTIDNLKFSAVSSTGTIYGLYSNSTNTNLNSNIIKNLFIPFTSTIYGISDAAPAGTKTINSNQIFNFGTSTGGTGGSNFYGVYCINGTVTVGNNNIYSLNISGNNATVASTVRGIRLDSPTNTIFNNKIYDLSANSTFGSTLGISTSTGNTTLYNNVVSNLRAPNSTGTFATTGFLINGSVSLYYNTILLNETVKNAGNSGSTAVFFNSSGTLISRNNILINTSVVSGTGRAVALNCANFATTYDTSSNNNLLHASTLFVSGGVSDTTLAAFKTRMATRDQNSVTETTTPFISTDGSSADFLRLPLNANTEANNNGAPITSPAITLDYFGETRDTTTPDIGASEFSGTLGSETFSFNSKISVYPNPSKDIFSINSDARGSIVIYDIMGKIIKTENLDLGMTKLDLSNYPNGIYLMKVTNESNQTKTMKLIKQ